MQPHFSLCGRFGKREMTAFQQCWVIQSWAEILVFVKLYMSALMSLAMSLLILLYSLLTLFNFYSCFRRCVISVTCIIPRISLILYYDSTIHQNQGFNYMIEYKSIFPCSAEQEGPKDLHYKMFTKLRLANKISNIIIAILSASIYNAVILISATQQLGRLELSSPFM